MPKTRDLLPAAVGVNWSWLDKLCKPPCFLLGLKAAWVPLVTTSSKCQCFQTTRIDSKRWPCHWAMGCTSYTRHRTAPCFPVWTHSRWDPRRTITAWRAITLYTVQKHLFQPNPIPTASASTCRVSCSLAWYFSVKQPESGVSKYHQISSTKLPKTLNLELPKTQV